LPCFIQLTLIPQLGTEQKRPIYKNMARISTIQVRAGGGSDLWDSGKCTRVAESPAQILALIKEAGR
jgi:hypothetical protein